MSPAATPQAFWSVEPNSGLPELLGFPELQAVNSLVGHQKTDHDQDRGHQRGVLALHPVFESRQRSREAMTVVIATHDVVVASCCDRVVRIVDGRVRDQIDVLAAADPQGTLARLARPAPR
ncbi:MAG: hypothetical protein QOC63_5513 [Mycobacterium sp.]|nr:hypothetical protein [Mycobacterium sp.]